MNTILTSRGESPEEIPASAIKASWGRVRDKALRMGAVVITTRKRAEFVILSMEEYHRQCHSAEASLESLQRSFDERVACMQGDKVQAGVDAVFNLNPREFSRAAIKSVRERHGQSKPKKKT